MERERGMEGERERGRESERGREQGREREGLWRESECFVISEGISYWSQFS